MSIVRSHPKEIIQNKQKAKGKTYIISSTIVFNLREKKKKQQQLECPKLGAVQGNN